MGNQNYIFGKGQMGFSEGNNMNFIIHIYIQTLANKWLGYACEDCDYESVSKQQLNLHMVSKHDGEKISCDKCDY